MERVLTNGKIVKLALSRDDLKIVTFDWLLECLNKGRLLSTRKYEWTIIDKTALKKLVKEGKLESGNQSYAQAFVEHTKQYAGPTLDSHDEPSSRKRKASKAKKGILKKDTVKKNFARGAKIGWFDLMSSTSSAGFLICLSPLTFLRQLPHLPRRHWIRVRGYSHEGRVQPQLERTSHHHGMLRSHD